MLNRNKIKILHVISQQPGYTGSGFYLRAMLDKSNQRGHENFMLAGIPTGVNPVIESIPPMNCCYVRFDGGDLSFPVTGMSDVMPYESTRFNDMTEEQIELYEAAFEKKLKEAVERFQPDVIHCHHLWIVTSLTRKLFPDIPVMATSHGTGLRQFNNMPRFRDRIKEGCSKLDHIMALSKVQKHEISELFNFSPDKITVVGGGYERDRFYKGIKNRTEPIELMYAGKISSAKGIPWLAQALESIKELPWHLNVVGGGSGKDYEACIEAVQKLEDRVTIHGRLPHHEQVAQMMRKSHIFVLPSLFEGLPLVLLEALASGCRIVSTSLPGVTEVLGNLDNRYVKLAQLPPTEKNERPAKNYEKPFVKSLSDALKEQIENSIYEPDLALDEIDEILNRYSWSSVFDRTEKVLLSANQFRSSSF